MIKRPGKRSRTRALQLLEVLETRELLSASLPGVNLRRKSKSPTAQMTAIHVNNPLPAAGSFSPQATSPASNWFTPAQLRHAYGLDQVMFGDIIGDGTGQTIAIIDAYHYTTASSDLLAFSNYFGLPALADYTGPGMSVPYFRQVAQDGSTNYPSVDPHTNPNVLPWSVESALDIEWAHAMAPAANIILVEANSATYDDMVGTAFNTGGAADWARHQTGVSVISMSFGGNENGLAYLDSYFTTPAGHNGVTFVAATGDTGASGFYPAASPNVVAVGGTSLTLDGNSYLSETAWNGSNGGVSGQSVKPTFQAGLTNSLTFRSTPDVSMVADPGTGVAVYDSADYAGSPWQEFGGTSVATPLFAGVLAVTNQGRILNGFSTLDGRSDTLQKLYSAPSSDFHDVTSGNNAGFSAGPGYDLVTGRGSPVASNLVQDLAGTPNAISGHAYSDNNANSTFDTGDSTLSGVRVYVDANNNGIFDATGTPSPFSTGAISASIPDRSNGGITYPVSVNGLGGPVTDVNVTVNITHPRDSDLSIFLIAPDGTQITLLSNSGNSGASGANFTNTTFDDSALSTIHAGTAPFTGTYKSNQLLSALNGKSANGAWALKIVDNVRFMTGTLTSWALTLTTGAEINTISGNDGTFALPNLPAGTSRVREVLPSNQIQNGPTSYLLSLHGDTSQADFFNTPTAFTASGTSNSFYLWRDQGKIKIALGSTPTNPAYQFPEQSLPNLSFTLAGTASFITFDFTGGTPMSVANVSVDGAGLTDGGIIIIGAAMNVTMTNTQIAGDTGGVLSYNNVGLMTIHNALIQHFGPFGSVANLTIDANSTLFWN